jgi:predicted metal-dependent peptidase
MIYAIDSSGSTSGFVMMEMCSFVKKQADATKVLFFDTEVLKVLDAKTFSYKDAIGRGGTLIQPVFDWMRDNAPGEDLAIISDGYFFERDIQTHGIRAACYLTSNAAQAHIETANLKAFAHIADMPQ